MKELETSLGQIESMFSNWRDQKYRMAIFNYKKGKIKAATSLALGFQEMSDTYYEPNILFLMDIAKVTNNYDLFKEELKYWIRSQVFVHNLYLERNEESIIFKDQKKKSFISFEEKDGKVYCFLDNDILRDLFNSSVALRKKRGTKDHRSEWNKFKMRVATLLNRSKYFGIEIQKEGNIQPQEIRSNVANYFKIKQQKESMIKSKRIFFQREKRRVSKELSAKGSHPYYVKMKLNLLKRKEQKEIKKLTFELDKKAQVSVSNLQKVTDWDKVLRKIELKNKILKIFYR